MAYYHSKYGAGPPKKKKRGRHKIILPVLFILLLISLAVAYALYSVIYKSNVWTGDEESIPFFIKTGSTYEDVRQNLYGSGLIVHRNSFEWLSQKKNYPQNVKPGRYIIFNGMSNDELINLLRSGIQTPVNVTFNYVRNIEQLAQKVGWQIEADSASIASLLSDTAYIAKYGMTPLTISTMFIPNTYEFWWTATAAGFVERMYQEYQKFWNESRLQKADAIGLSIPEVIIVASIIEKETNKNDEKATIAGVYLNRLDRNWKLQADPTLVYAWGDFSINRVLNIHKKIDSPYNTYKYAGLPPGPICIPSIASIDAVLNYENHDYMFFCAKADMSGYHTFAKTLIQHNRNAKEYQKELDKIR